jgi:hypothetical protein
MCRFGEGLVLYYYYYYYIRMRGVGGSEMKLLQRWAGKGN